MALSALLVSSTQLQSNEGSWNVFICLSRWRSTT